MRYVKLLLACALGIGVLVDVREQRKMSAAIADQGDRLGALQSDTATLVTEIRRLETEVLFRQASSSGPCQPADSSKSTVAAQPSEGSSPEKATPPREVDWSAYERARSILDRGVSNGTWTQADADEFRVAASAAGGEKTIELVRMKVAALNAQKIHGRFVP